MPSVPAAVHARWVAYCQKLATAQMLHYDHKCPFLELPVELRLRIYDYVIVNDVAAADITKITPLRHPMLEVCKSVRREANQEFDDEGIRLFSEKLDDILSEAYDREDEAFASFHGVWVLSEEGAKFWHDEYDLAQDRSYQAERAQAWVKCEERKRIHRCNYTD
ncbi:hypothetical protein Slin15195_G038780 [Septoria linicola]|uniref:F-box domain-containing protein n=1 Tax=Septoria linicola TaxID=215465 RepID=A0A9Q9AM22_9PEZI|nr:hypothetical protein Slin15195_G038780 [Septoria linicola]